MPFTLCLLALLAALPSKELNRAMKTVISAASYTFTVQDGEAGASLEGTFQKGTPLHCWADQLEFYRQGNVLVYRQGDRWLRTRTGTLSDPLTILGASAQVRAVRLPHEELAGLVNAVQEVKKEKDQGGIRFEVEFGEKVARELARQEDRNLARSGKAKFWLDGQGSLTKYQITIHIQGRRGNAEVNGLMTKTVTLDQIGKEKVEVPPEAKKVLE